MTDAPDAGQLNPPDAGRLDPEGPGWLDPTEQAAWLALGALVMRLPMALDTDLQTASGLSLFEYMVLAVLSEAPHRTMGMSELGARVSSSPSRLSHGIARLERHGWVGRAPLPEDGRQIVATLTPAGYRKVEDSAPPHVRSVRKLVIDVLTAAELRQLRLIADAILASVDTTLGPTRVCRSFAPSGAESLGSSRPSCTPVHIPSGGRD